MSRRNPWEFSASCRSAALRPDCTLCKPAACILMVVLCYQSYSRRLKSGLKCMRMLPHIHLGAYTKRPSLETLSRAFRGSNRRCLDELGSVHFEEFVMQIMADRKKQPFNTKAHLPAPPNISTEKIVYFFQSHIFPL